MPQTLDPIAHDPSAHDPIAHAKAYIDANFEQPLDLDMLARRAHFSPFHFLRRFRQSYAETPHAYLTRMRMSRARELLAQTRLSVTDVCLDVGYTSLGSFSSSFRRYVGHSPYNYRARIYQSIAVTQSAARFIPYCFVFMRGLGLQDSSARR